MKASFKFTVTVDVATPFAMTGDVPVMVEFAATAEPGLNTTVEPVKAIGETRERIFDSAVVEARVQVETPDEFVAEQAPKVFVVPESVAENVGVVPITALLLASFKVIVMVDVAEPSARTGVVPEIEEFATDAPPGVNTTLLPAFTTGVAIESVFVSATVELKVQVEIPNEVVAEQVP